MVKNKKILQEKGLWKPDKEEEEPLEPFTIKCPFCSVTNIRESQYCKECGRPLHLEQIKSMEKKAQYMEVLQEMMQQELEKKGVDLGKIAKIFIAKAK